MPSMHPADAMRRLVLGRAVLPLAAAITPFETHRVLGAMLETDFEELDVQVARREARLAELLRHAVTQTSLYRERLPAPLDGLERPDGFATLPITQKDDLRDGFPDRQLAASHRGAWLRYSNTSGTTGRPLLLIQDIRDISAKYASILRSRVLAGVDPMGSQARITPNECRPAPPDHVADPTGDAPAARAAPGTGHRLFRFLERQIVNPFFHRRLMLEPFWGSRAPTTPVDLDRYLDRIDRFEPEILTLYPPYARMLAQHLMRSGRRPPRVRGVVDFSAAMCTPSMRATITEGFGRPTAQGCGGCEFARYGASCAADPDRMHLAETYCYVETVRPDGQPCAPGELGNVIATSLHSWAMPVIRLEPGDVARILVEPCACGRKSRRIEHHGRVHSMTRTADGRWVTGRQVWERLFAVPGVSLFELRQLDPGRYELDVLPAPGAALDRSALNAALDELLGAEVERAIEEVATLRTQGSGKLQLVRSTTYEGFRVPSERARSVPVN